MVAKYQNRTDFVWLMKPQRYPTYHSQYKGIALLTSIRQLTSYLAMQFQITKKLKYSAT